VTAPDVRLVLASASPRRADVLDALSLAHVVDPAHVPEEQAPGESAATFVERLAREKAGAVAARHPEAYVLAGDTVVVLDEHVLGKPEDEEQAVGMLLRLSDREHVVSTGLALASPGGTIVSGVDTTRVRMRRIDRRTARSYVASGEPMDKAGAYGIQGRGGALVRGVEGDYFTVMGFPVALFIDLLGRARLRYDFGRIVPEEPTP
jgi:septum formation protein